MQTNRLLLFHLIRTIEHPRVHMGWGVPKLVLHLTTTHILRRGIYARALDFVLLTFALCADVLGLAHVFLFVDEALVLFAVLVAGGLLEFSHVVDFLVDALV